MTITPVSAYGTAKWIVSPTAGQGTHTTIAAALTAASSGDTIFIRPGAYTENPTLKAGVSLSAYGCDAYNNVAIIGKCTFTGTGTVALSGLILETNSDFALAVTGSGNSTVDVFGCSIVGLTHTSVSLTSSGASSITFYSCNLDLQTTGIAYHTMTNGNNIHYIGCFFNNSGNSITSADNSAGAVLLESCSSFGPFSCSSTGSLGLFNCNLDLSASNGTEVTANGTGANVVTNCYIAGGTASAVSVGVGASLLLTNCTVQSTNTNAVTGAGTLNYSGLYFSGTIKMNTTTQVGGVGQGGVLQAPTAGFIGEQIRSYVTAVGLTTATPKNVTSISLTPGIWDVTGFAVFIPGGATVTTIFTISLSSTSATLAGNFGDTDATFTYGSGILSFYCTLSVPALRVTVSSTTIYYLVASSTFSGSTQSVNGRISATRVG